MACADGMAATPLVWLPDVDENALAVDHALMRLGGRVLSHPGS